MENGACASAGRGVRTRRAILRRKRKRGNGEPRLKPNIRSETAPTQRATEAVKRAEDAEKRATDAEKRAAKPTPTATVQPGQSKPKREA